MSETTMVSNGAKLRKFRLKQGMSQSELAAIVGRGNRDISKYEKGLREIPQAVVEYLNKKYHTKLEPTGKVVKGRVDYPHAEDFTSTSLADTISSLRKSMGLSQRAFAKKFDMDQANLCRIETKKVFSLNERAIKAFQRYGIDTSKMV